MKTIFEHIEHIKTKPHHIRKQMAFSIAGGVTALVALVWLVGSLSLGVFALSGSSFADSAGEGSAIVTSGPGTSNVAGAAAAVPEVNAPARIEIVDSPASTVNQKKAEPTIIPF